MGPDKLEAIALEYAHSLTGPFDHLDVHRHIRGMAERIEPAEVWRWLRADSGLGWDQKTGLFTVQGALTC